MNANQADEGEVLSGQSITNMENEGDSLSVLNNSNEKNESETFSVLDQVTDGIQENLFAPQETGEIPNLIAHEENEGESLSVQNREIMSDARHLSAQEASKQYTPGDNNTKHQHISRIEQCTGILKPQKIGNENHPNNNVKKKVKQINVLEIFMLIIIISNYITNDHRNTFEYADKAKDLNVNKLNSIVDLNKYISKEINENEGEIPSVNPSQSIEIKGLITEQHINNDISTFVVAMIFAQTEKTSNKRLRMRNVSDNLSCKLEQEKMNSNNEMNNDNEVYFKNEMNSENLQHSTSMISNIEVHEGALSSNKISNHITHIQNNRINYQYKYDLPFKERLKQDMKENDRNCYDLPPVSTVIIILNVLIKMIMMVFKAFDFKEDEDMYRKKAYDDVSRHVDVVKYTTMIVPAQLANACRCLGSNVQCQIMSIIQYKITKVKEILLRFNRHATEQTITTNEGVLEYGKLPLRNVICLKLFEIIF